METLKVRNMTSSRGNTVPNQFILAGHNVSFFQSYDSTIAKEEYTANGKEVTLDQVYWDYSRTTAKYLGQFLGESMKDVRRKVKDGTYKLDDLN